MPMFKSDSSNAGGSFGILPEADYECVISEIKQDVSKGEKTKGALMLKITYTIREDVEQEGKKRKIFDQLIDHESTSFKFDQLYAALGFEDGREFNSVEEVIDAIAYGCVIVHTKNEVYQEKTSAKVHYLKPSEVEKANKPANGGNYDPFADNGQPIDISADDLPF